MVGSFKNYYSLIFFLSAAIFSLHAGSDEELFLRGNTYYNEKNYAKALESYQQMGNKGRAVFYSIGNCFYQQGDHAQALVYWSRAQHGATVSEYKAIENNKQIALKKMSKQSSENNAVGFLDQFYVVALQPSLLLLQLLFLVLWVLVLFALRKQRKGVYKALQGAALMCLFCITNMLIVHFRSGSSRSAIVMKNEVALLNGPDNTFQTISSISYAENVRVQEARKGWCKVQYADMIGWVEEDSIQII